MTPTCQNEECNMSTRMVETKFGAICPECGNALVYLKNDKEYIRFVDQLISVLPLVSKQRALSAIIYLRTTIAHNPRLDEYEKEEAEKELDLILCHISKKNKQ